MLFTKQISFDKPWYTILKRGPTSNIQQKANITNFWFEKSENDIWRKKRKIYNSISPKYYGVPKIQKPIITLSISSIEGKNCKISELITKILICTHKFLGEIIKDLVEFVSFITKNTENSRASWKTERWNVIEWKCQISQSKFLEVTNFVFNSSYFWFYGAYYKKILETPLDATIFLSM